MKTLIVQDRDLQRKNTFLLISFTRETKFSWVMRSGTETWCLERESVMSVLGDWSDIKLSIRRHMAVIKVDIIFLQKNRLYQTISTVNIFFLLHLAYS